MMRFGSSIAMGLLVGCAGQPPAAPPAVVVRPAIAAQPAAVVAATPATAAAQPETHKVKVDASNVVEVQQAGYKLVNKNGEPLYCRTDPITGSRIQTKTVCLTERELHTQMNATQQSMGQVSAHQVGPSGH